MSIAAKQKELIATAVAAALIAVAVGAMGLTHHRPEGAIFLSLFAAFALAVAIACVVIIFREHKQSLGGPIAGKRASYVLADPTIPLANPATGLPLARASYMDVGGNTYGQAPKAD